MKFVVGCVTTLVIAAVAAVVVLTGMGKDSTVLLSLLGAILLPTITSLITLIRVESVHRNVNGRMSEIISKVPDPDPTTERSPDRAGVSDVQVNLRGDTNG